MYKLGAIRAKVGVEAQKVAKVEIGVSLPSVKTLKAIPASLFLPIIQGLF